MDYRIYILTNRDESHLDLRIEFSDDEAAISRTKELLGDSYAAEVWNEDRLVARLGDPYLIDVAKRDRNAPKLR